MPLSLRHPGGPVGFFAQAAVGFVFEPTRRTVGAAAIVTLLMPYTALNLAPLEPLSRYAAGLVLAYAALTIALWAGLARPAPVGRGPLKPRGWSRRAGWAALWVVTAALAIAMLAWHGHVTDGVWFIVYAPASAFAQEMYFRGHLLSALDELYPRARGATLLLQALAFAGWHARAFLEADALVATLFVTGTFAAGLVWGGLARRSGSLAGCITTHTLALVGWNVLLLLQGQPIE